MWHPLSAKVGNHFAGSCSVGVFRSRTQTMEFDFFVCLFWNLPFANDCWRGHQVKWRGDRLEFREWPHNFTPPFCPRMRLKLQSAVYVSNVQPLTHTLMMEEISEILDSYWSSYKSLPYLSTVKTSGFKYYLYYIIYINLCLVSDLFIWLNYVVSFLN
jgi:hypothetical protein